MTIEAKLDRMIELLEQIAGNERPAASAAPAPAASPVKAVVKPAAKLAPKKSVATLDDLKVSLKKVLDDKDYGGKDVAVEILARFGAARLGELSESQYDEVRERCDLVLAGTHQANGDPVSAGDELM